MYLRARYYSPLEGRFQSRDTWEGNDNSPQTLNQWGYVNNNPINYTDPSGHWCVAGFSAGPGRDCTQEETQRWGKFYFNQAYLLAKLMNHNHDQESQQIAEGFAYEYLDTVFVLPVMSAIFEIGDQLNGCGSWSDNYYKGVLYGVQHNNNQWFIAGRYLATAFLVGQALTEVGAGLGGINGGIGLSIGSAGLAAVIGIPIAEMSALLVGHGTLVLAAVAARNRFNPLPPLNFAAISGGDGGRGAPVPKPGGTTGQGRVKGTKPPSRTSGIYEYIDQKTGKWYVGKSEDLYSRLRTHIANKELASWDDVIWTEIRTSSDKALRVAERVRYEQMVEMVGGPQNMANVPTKLTPLEDVFRYFDEGWPQTISSWPNWLTKP